VRGPEQKFEQKKYEQNVSVLDPLTRPGGRVIEDDCIFCGKRTKHLDDGKNCDCLECSPRVAATAVADSCAPSSTDNEVPF
jgi:hypothetical protein